MTTRVLPAFGSFPLALAAALLTAAAAGADVIVLRDGSRVETRAGWQERGRQVVFTDLDGKLCALRLADVDLDASRAATAAAARPAAPAATKPAAAPAVVLDLDENDFGVGADPEAEPRSVTLFAADWCGVCRKTEQYFQEIGVAYLRRDVDADPTARLERDLRSGGQQVVPVVDWGGEILVGFKRSRFAELALEDKLLAAERERRAAERARDEREAAAEATVDETAGGVDAAAAAPDSEVPEPPRN
jgi:glutaredoxin